MSTESPVPKNVPKSPLRAGWILVTGLLSLCVLGTWLTARNYRSQVFSSARATVLENQWPESRISAEFSPGEAARIRPGMVAKITLGEDKKVLLGSVVSVGLGKNPNAVVIRLTAEPPSGSGKNPAHYLTAGLPCSVTVDSTVPPAATTAQTPQSPASR